MALKLPHWLAERAIGTQRKLSGGRLEGKPDGLRSPAAPSPPLGVTRFERNARRLAGVCAYAAALGLAPGMMLTEARALAPELTFCEEEPRADARALNALALWCRRYAPHVATRGGDGVVVDITGAAHLFGGEAAVLADVLARLKGFGYTVRGAIADTGPGALALAHAHPHAISAPGALAEDLAPLPVAALGLGEEEVSALHMLGLRRIGDLAALPRASRRARLGLEVMARLDAALGVRATPLSPLTEIVPVRAFRRFFEPLERPEDILACLAGLAGAVAEGLGRRDEGARELILSLYRVDGAVKTVEIATSAPMREAPRMVALFADRMKRLEGGLEPGYGFDLIALEARRTGPLVPAHIPINPHQTASSSGHPIDCTLGGGRVGERAGADLNSAETLAPLIDRLATRLGPSAVRRMEPAQSHLPERAVVLAPILASRDRGYPDWRGEPWGGRSGTPLARPLQLLPSPEPIEAVAEVPDRAPVRFTWRRISHRVVAADGPERIAAEWWREAAPTRDYFRLEDEHGQRFWVYRLGLYGRETTAPRWYMHGLLP
ncbi:DNA polymerase-like protein PA0670 [hydrothermal vent metagenome]|uniref:DNA polymerase-like protein PA0670 n=1 Tax=hydrothermal vent metagenome TaxID=652676 RepID=A0A3B0TQ36_9ZZZZ